MSEPFFSSRSLDLGNSELFKKIKSCLESFIMFNAHYNKVALSVSGKIYRLILLMTQRRNVPCLIAEA